MLLSTVCLEIFFFKVVHFWRKNLVLKKKEEFWKNIILFRKLLHFLNKGPYFHFMVISEMG